MTLALDLRLLQVAVALEDWELDLAWQGRVPGPEGEVLGGAGAGEGEAEPGAGARRLLVPRSGHSAVRAGPGAGTPAGVQSRRV